MIVHIDCNSFFASCELSDNQHLVGTPVVVANINDNNGGVILALNNEAKLVGLKRGEPLFMVKSIIAKHGVTVFPVDHVKYRCISQQIMSIVRQQGIVLNFVQYSVDEFFGELPTDDKAELKHYVSIVKNEIEQQTLIPVSCGCSLTYTLAKVATHFAKRYAGYQGVCVLERQNIEKALSKLKVEDIWGIGRKLSKNLQHYGIETAIKFYNLPEEQVCRLMTTPGVNTWRELHGIQSVKLAFHDVQKSINHSRTFSRMTSDKEWLRENLSAYIGDCAEKLRKQKSKCRLVSVYLETNRHRDDLQQYGNVSTAKLDDYTDLTSKLLHAALALLDEIFLPGYQYKYMGVGLSDIKEEQDLQQSLFKDEKEVQQRKVYEVMDTINRKMDSKIVRLAIESDGGRKE